MHFLHFGYIHNAQAVFEGKGFQLRKLRAIHSKYIKREFAATNLSISPVHSSNLPTFISLVDRQVWHSNPTSFWLFLNQ